MKTPREDIVDAITEFLSLGYGLVPSITAEKIMKIVERVEEEHWIRKQEADMETHAYESYR